MTKQKRPEVLTGKTFKTKTNCGSLYTTLNYDDKELVEIRLQIGKSGNCIRSLLEAFSILFSVFLQSGIPKEKIIKTIKRHCLGTNCGNPFFHDGKQFLSCLDFVSQQILKELEGSDEVSEQKVSSEPVQQKV